jgi:hypothetical protein
LMSLVGFASLSSMACLILGLIGARFEPACLGAP